MLVLPATLVTAGPRLDARHMIFCPFMLAKGGSLTGFSPAASEILYITCVYFEHGYPLLRQTALTYFLSQSEFVFHFGSNANRFS